MRTLIIKYGIYANIFAEKMWVAFAFHIFVSKSTCELDTVLTRTFNILTSNELVQLTTLWTTGPWYFYGNRDAMHENIIKPTLSYGGVWASFNLLFEFMALITSNFKKAYFYRNAQQQVAVNLQPQHVWKHLE